MTRVAIIGNAGGGKSTVCKALSAKLGLPHHSIDQIQWMPGWVPTPPDEYDRRHDNLVARDRWIIDGFGSWESVERRFDAADTIIFVDHPLWVHYWWATKRQIRSIFGGRPDGPEGCPMLPVTFRLYRMMWRIHKDLRPKLLNALLKYGNTRRIIHIRSREELEAFAARA